MVAAVALLSAGALAFEVLLVRLFAIAHWHHFASMVISLALLGYGASGTLFAFVRAALLARPRTAVAASAALFGLFAPAAVSLAQALPLNVLEIAWDPAQPLVLVAVFLVLAVPFVCAGLGIAVALAAAGQRVGRVYRAVLVGAGVGALGVVGLLSVVPVEAGFRAVAGLGFAAAAAAALADRRAAAALAVAGLVVASAWPAGSIAPQPSPYKPLSRALDVPGAEIVAERSSPLGWIAVVQSPEIPFRHAPGLSLTARAEPPPQLGLFVDAGAMTAITRFDGRTEPIAYLNEQTAALPYRLVDRPRVLVLGAGGGAGVLRAILNDAARIDAVEADAEIVGLVRGPFSAFAGGVYDRPDVTVAIADARAVAEREGPAYDIVEIEALGSPAASASGLHAGGLALKFTVEAFEAYLGRLAPGGVLAVTTWTRAPPQASLKLFATAVAALRARGVERPGERLALIRGWRTATLLVGNGAWEGGDLDAIRAFCRRFGFDLGYLPGMTAGEANRFHRLDRPYFHAGATALAGPEAEAFLARYKYDVGPATDDRPAFFRFLTWRGFAELVGSHGRGGLNLVEWGYPVLVATLAQAVVAGTVLVLLPLVARERRRAISAGADARPVARAALYFATLGLAFLFVEIAFVHRFQLLLGHPVLAVAVVLAGFLVFAGLGAGLSRNLAERLGGQRRAVVAAVAAIALLAFALVLAMPAAFEALRPLPFAVRLAAALALVAPIAACMGVPFPVGLAWLDRRAPDLVPWAWGINGCASVVSAVLASVLAIHLGFAAVVFAAIALYAVAALAIPGDAGGSAGRADGIS